MGTRYRLLQCVWYGTRKTAGNACNNHPRPAVMKPCRGPPCVVDRKFYMPDLKKIVNIGRCFNNIILESAELNRNLFFNAAKALKHIKIIIS